MKLAEALLERAGVQRSIEQLQERLKNVALVQAGEVAAEDPQALLRELDKAYGKLVVLVQRINRTNAATRVGDRCTLTDLLAQRDLLKKQNQFLHDFANAAVPKKERYAAGQAKYKPSVSVPEIRKAADKVAADYRKLEVQIQELNWQVEVAS